MPVHVIPFQMPEPMAIPEHIAAHLRQLPAPEAVRAGMELLMQIEVADVMLFEAVDGAGRLHLVEVVTRGEADAEAWKARLAGQPFYGQPVTTASGLGGRALAKGQALLVMGEAAAGEDTPLPPALATALLGEHGGRAGFVYVLPMTDASGEPKGVLTVIRGAPEGPLNHEQPNLTETMRQLLAERLSAE